MHEHEIQELQKQYDELRQDLQGVADKLNDYKKERLEAENENLLWRCYAFRNSYSLPQDESDYWYTYCQVVGLSGDMVEVNKFELDKYGNPSITTDIQRLTNDWKQIGYMEMCEAWDKFIGVVNGLAPREPE